MKKTKIVFNKPYPVGTCVLELSKLHTYDMLHNYIKIKWSDRVKVLTTDTDSVVLEIENEDDYKDIAIDILERFDTSNYPKDCPIYTDVNKKVIGKFKDEAGGMQTKELSGSNAKVYCILMDEGDEVKKCKGVKRAVVKTSLHHEDFKNCVLKKENQMRKMNVIRSNKHEIYTETVCKVALSHKDDKHIIREDGIHTYAHGHYKTL